jgi:hypothetical protein
MGVDRRDYTKSIRQSSTSERKARALSGHWLDRLKEMSADLAVPREEVLGLMSGAESVLYKRAINVESQVAADGKTVDQLREAIIWEEKLPDGTTREAIEPECKYLPQSPVGNPSL